MSTLASSRLRGLSKHLLSAQSYEPSIMFLLTPHSGLQVLPGLEKKSQLRLTRTIAIVVDWWREVEKQKQCTVTRDLQQWREGTTSTSLSLQQAYIARGLPFGVYDATSHHAPAIQFPSPYASNSQSQETELNPATEHFQRCPSRKRRRRWSFMTSTLTGTDSTGCATVCSHC